MKIALVNLPLWSVYTPPLGLSYISASLKEAGYDVSVFDGNVRLWNDFKNDEDDLWEFRNYYKWQSDDLFYKNTLPHIKPNLDCFIEEIIRGDFDIVGFSVFDTSLHVTKYATNRMQETKPCIKIVYGGPASSSDAVKELIRSKEQDAAVIGEGEKTIIELVKSWENGSPIANIPGTLTKDDQGSPVIGPKRLLMNVDELPLPDFQDFSLSSYKEFALPIMMSRGCIGACTFCSEVRYWKTYRARSAKHVINELRSGSQKYGIPKFLTSDSLLNGKHSILEHIVNDIISEGLNIHWGGYARIDKRLTAELLSKMKRAGCDFLSYGLESGSPKVLKLMNKGITIKEAQRTIRDTHQAGIEVHLNMIVGFPGEDEEQFQETLAFLKEAKEYVDVVNTGETLAIFENTALYEFPDKFGILTDSNGNIVYDQEGGWVTKEQEKHHLDTKIARVAIKKISRGKSHKLQSETK